MPSLLAEREGAIVNITDAYAARLPAGFAAYAATKAALADLTRSLARESAPKIRVNAVARGAILWPQPEPDEAAKQKVLASIPLARLGSPDDIARAVAFLAVNPFFHGRHLPHGRRPHLELTDHPQKGKRGSYEPIHYGRTFLKPVSFAHSSLFTTSEDSVTQLDPLDSHLGSGYNSPKKRMRHHRGRGMLPSLLYRGDADPRRIRRLKQLWDIYGYLSTNMAAGGNPYEIFNESLILCLKRHIDLGWEKTHFLSFTERYDIAQRFAAGSDEHELIRETSPSRWDAAVLILDTSRFSSVRLLEMGVYAATFASRQIVGDTQELSDSLMRLAANLTRQGRTVNILLVDVGAHLRANASAHAGLDSALKKAERDNEWLVLPTDPPKGDSHGFTAFLDQTCIARCDKYIFVESPSFRAREVT